MKDQPDQNKLIEGAVEAYNISARNVIEALRRANVDNINRLFAGLQEHRRTIKRLLKDHSALVVLKPEVGKVVKAISDDEDVCKKLMQHDVEDIEDYYDGIDYILELNNEYDLENVILRKMQAGVVVLGRKVPDTYIALLDKIRECYAFGFNEATILFCRALIEECLNGYYTLHASINAPRELDKKIDYLKHSNAGPGLKATLHSVRKRANEILHRARIDRPTIRKATIQVTNQGSWDVSAKNNKHMEKNALNAIKTTIALIEAVHK